MLTVPHCPENWDVFSVGFPLDFPASLAESILLSKVAECFVCFALTFAGFRRTLPELLLGWTV